jgi:imidazolonepropionase-like amidohydrolase
MKKTIIGGVAAVAIAAVIVACGGGGGNDAFDVTQGTVIKNASIVNTRDGSILFAKSIVLDGGKITKISASDANISGTATAVDGSGKFVVPGFNDMHTHAMVAVDQTPPYWPLMIANGITGIREMSGSAAVIQRARQLNTDSAAHNVDAPEVLLVPSDIFGGQSPTAAGAAAFVDAKKADGADFIKMTGGTRDAVLGLIQEAKVQNLDVAGHLSPAVSALDSSNAGMRAVEHLGAGWGLILDCSTDQPNIRATAAPLQATLQPLPADFTVNPRVYDGTLNAPFYQRILDTYSDNLCQSLAQTFIKNGTWQPVTLIRLRTQDYGNDPLYTADPNLKYVDRTRVALWNQLAQKFSLLPASAVTTLRAYYEQQKKVTKLMKQAGVGILAGSDLGGQWVVPGFSLHQEFKELSASGLSPLEILQATTLNGAQFLRREATMGTVDEGKNADLVLLDANPVADVANLDKVSGVFLKGKYFSKDALDKMKSDVASAYAAIPIQALSTALDPTHVD